MKSQGGFTLIELMVVVAIIGILAAIAIPQFAIYRASAHDKDAQTALRRVVIGQEAYFINNQTYASCDQTNCTTIMPEIGRLSPDIELQFTATGSSCTGTAKHNNGTGAVFDWSS